MAEAETVRQIATVDARLAEIDQRLPASELRDRVAAERPDDCVCFGAGGTGRILAVEAGRPIFETPCPGCPEGESLSAMISDRYAAVRRVTREHWREDRAYVNAEKQRWIDGALERSGLDHGAYDDRFDAYRQIAAPLPPTLDVLIDEMIERCSQPISVPHGMFLFGPSGHGKTGLARCCGRLWINQGRNALFIGASEIFNRLYRGYSKSDGSADALLEMLRNAPLLIVDDLGTERPTEHNRSHLLDLLLWRHAERNRLVTIITSNYGIQETAMRIADTGDGDAEEVARISGRLSEMCDAFEIVNRDLRAAA